MDPARATVSSIDPISHEWTELAEGLGACPFSHPGWIEAWHEAFGRGRLEVLTARREGRLVGVLPLQRRLGVLQSTSNWHTPRYEPLQTDHETLQALVEHASRHVRGRLDLAFVDEASDVGGAIELVASRLSATRESRLIQRSPYVELDGDWGSFIQALPSRKRRKVLRSRDALEQRGELSIQVEDGSNDLDAALEAGENGG